MGRTTGEGQLLRSARDARAMRLAAAALACGALLVQSTTAAAAAVTNPYGAGTTGYDVGYPNCTETPPGGFAIVGLGGGRPFTTNGCLGSLLGPFETKDQEDGRINNVRRYNRL